MKTYRINTKVRITEYRNEVVEVEAESLDDAERKVWAWDPTCRVAETSMYDEEIVIDEITGGE